MAKLANTFTTDNAVGNREELSDVVSRITPEDTPIYSMINKTSTKSIHPEWETDDLDAPGENFHVEGDEFNFEAIKPPSRAGNYTQILEKSWSLSRSQAAVDNAGNVEKVKYQKLKKSIGLRKDLEFAILSNTASVAGEPRKMGSLASWYKTNVSRGANGANGGFNTSTGLTVAATAGTKRAFTKALLDSTMQQIYQSGGTPKFVVCSPYVKSVFTTFMSDSNVAQFRYSASGGKNTIIATADVYEGDFGKVMIVPNRVQADDRVSDNVHILDPSLLEMKMLTNIQNVPNLAKTGDAETGVILCEGTLCVKNEKGIGVVADVYGMTATT